MPMPQTLAVGDPGVAQQLVEARVQAARRDRRRLREVEFEALLGQRRAREVADRCAAPAPVDIGHKHNAS